MLKKLILENWKSFRYAELPIDPLTVLIGTNASGKSNVVDALEFLRRIAQRIEFRNALAGDPVIPSIRGGVEWAALKPETQFTIKLQVQGENSTTDYLYNITVDTKPRIQLFTESLFKLQHSECDQTQIANLLQIDPPAQSDNSLTVRFDDGKTIMMGQRSVSILTFFNKKFFLGSERSWIGLGCINQTIQNIFILNPIPSKMRDYSPLSDTLESDASNIAGVLAALSDEQKTEFESIISTYVKHLPEQDIKRVWAEPVGRFKTDAMLYCEEEWKPSETIEMDARGMSDGTLRFLAILTALLTRPEGSQLVIEEVDNGLHPSRADLLLRMLREIGEKRKIDILVTTHNPALLDALDPEMLPFVVVAHRDSETGESKLTLLEDIENLPKLMASGSLGRLTTKGAIEKSLSDNR
jgi:predicted ATPase